MLICINIVPTIYHTDNDYHDNDCHIDTDYFIDNDNIKMPAK